MDYISFYGKHIKGLKKAGTQYLGLCPFHKDTSPSFSVNPSSGVWNCFGACNTGGNAIQFCRAKGLPESDAPDYNENYKIYSYAGGRTKKKTEDKKAFWEGATDSNKSPYNKEAIETARATGKRLWICEGEKDTVTMHSAGELAIGIPSASDLGGLDKQDFKGIKKIILAFDNDTAGRKATEKVLRFIPDASVINFPEGTPDKYDVTDLYEESGPDGFLDVIEEWIDYETPLTVFLSDKFIKSQDREPDIPLGYRLTNFRRLQDNIDGLQSGLYIVGADTSIGKTSFCVNLFLDLLRTNDTLTGIYFSLDDNMDVIINRMLATLSAIPINKIQKRIDNQQDKARLTRSYKELINLSEKNRLFIYDQTKVTGTKDVETYTRRRIDNPLFIVVDGLYNLDVDEDIEGTREKNIARANELKKIADVYRIPVICTAELRKSKQGSERNTPTVDSIMETGKFKYNANLILLLYPENMDFDNYDTQEDATIEIKYAKNKLSHYRGIDTVTFHRTYSGMDNMRKKE